MKQSLRARPALAGTLLAATALRLYRLGVDSLWYDETVSTALAGSPLSDLIRHTAGDIHPPGYYALLRGWLVLMGYPTGQADPHGLGLEFAAGFFSLIFGIVLITLIHVLADRLAGPRVALVAAALAALSPYNVWYSQEVRMYTLGAGLGVVALYALLQAVANRHSPSILWWAVYAVAAAAGMYTLYYFAFLLIPLNIWALWHIARCRKQILQSPSCIVHRPSRIFPWLLANGLAALLYAPWIPVAWRQAANPPVPPWRIAPDVFVALRESWSALSLGQSAPPWLWPALLLTLALYALGLVALTAPRSTQHAPRSTYIAAIATFAPLALILLISLVTPLYHVRYLFTYSPAFYVVLAAGLVWLLKRSRLVFGAAALTWLIAAGVTLSAFWSSPLYRTDDLRAAVRFLQERWRPGDVLLVNAGWPYTALTTYWEGPITSRSRLTDALPVPRDDGALIIVTTGHVDGDPGLGWADPRSDFFALPADVAQSQIAALFQRFNRVWHYRIYDTVNDPTGQIRGWLEVDGQLFEDQTFPGEAFMRVQGFLPRAARPAESSWPSAAFEPGLTLRAGPLPGQIASGETLYAELNWSPTAPLADFATSVRLVGPDGATWSQGADERPSGPLFPASRWPAGQTLRQTTALPVPSGTPPGAYTVELVVYNPATGQPWPAQAGDLALTSNGVLLGKVMIAPPQGKVATTKPLARFGPLALIAATSAATKVAAGGQIPVELLWQAIDAPGETLVMVIQLLGEGNVLAANLEAQPGNGHYPTTMWAAGELVRDRHTLNLPPDLPAGQYRLIIGVYRAADLKRLATRAGLFTTRDHWNIKTVTVE